MLSGQTFEVDRLATSGGLNINNFLQPKSNGFDKFKFSFTGVADEKFLTKLAKLIESEKGKDGPSTDTTKNHK